jgi:glycosyltransferase involved in cell wall biosynthesis
MLVQGASALLPHLIRRADVPSAIFLVADYSTWRPQEHFPWWRNQLIRTWTTVYTEQQKRATAGHVVLLQDPSLARSVRRPAEQHVVFTPSISEASLREWDAHQRPSRDPHAPFTLLYSGRIVREKGIFEAVTAVSLLSSKQIENRLWVMGWEEHGSGMIDALVRHADALGVRDRVEILGYQHGVDLLDRYALADACVIPTYWESFPRSAHEAMVLGLPLVSTNIGGMPYYVRDGETALLVEPRDAVGLASAVERLARDDAFRARVASSGREWARQHTLEAACREFVQILSRLAPAAVS